MPRKKQKTLADIVGKQGGGLRKDEPLPHIFHKHGAVKLVDSGQAMEDPDHMLWDMSNDHFRLQGYGVIAAGDDMVPYKSETGDIPLRVATRAAISTDLILTTGIADEVVIPPQPPGTSPYTAALNALATHQSSIGKATLKEAKDFLRKNGYKMQAKLLPAMLDMGLECAKHDTVDALEAFYLQFHMLYGKSTQEWPEKSDMTVKKMEGLTDKIDPMDWATKEPDPLGPPKDNSEANWGEMRIVRLPMKAWKHPTIRSRHSWKYSEFGTFKYPWRAMPTSDMQCFSMRRSKYAGTILLDMSGSMSIQKEHVEKILLHAPYATIAAYGSEPEHTRSGVLAICVENSMKADVDKIREHVGGGNVVDGPALRWLSKQAKPRIWISDGHVTGVQESQNQALFVDAQQICQSAGILRIPNIKELLDQLK